MFLNMSLGMVERRMGVAGGGGGFLLKQKEVNGPGKYV
jgi:hypothetical protein